MASYYVDPSINANSGTGTIGDPFGDFQYALDTVTQGASGDQFNIKSGSTEVLTAEIDITTYGTPNVTKPLIIRGYDSAENDGGRGVFSANDSTYSMWNKPAVEGLVCIDMDFKDISLDGQWCFRVDRACMFWRCRFTNLEGYAVYTSSNGNLLLIECAFISNSNRGGVLGALNSPIVYGCYFKGGGTISSFPQLTRGIAINCVFEGANYAIFGTELGLGFYANNTIIGKSATTGAAITNLQYMSCATNNIIQGFNGTGAFGINPAANAILINNKFYDNTTNIDSGALIEELNTTGTASLVEDVADENFAGSAEVQSEAIPTGTMIGTTDSGNGGTDLKLNIGAAQNKAAGGSVLHPLYATGRR